MKRFAMALSALVVLGAAARSPGSFTLDHNNSIVRIEPSPASQAGMFDWIVDGQDQISQQWFWYRVGAAGPESSISTISAPSISFTNGNRGVNVAYSDGSFGVEVDYVLTGGSTGSGVSHMDERITVSNSTAVAFVFHLFKFTNLDLGGTTGGDTVQLGKDLSGHFNEARQFEGVRICDTAANPGADHGEAALFNATLTKLNDPNPSTLNDNAGPVGPGDVTWALQWDLNIPGNSTVIIGLPIDLVAPEPSALLLIAPALLVPAARRDRRRRRSSN